LAFPAGRGREEIVRRISSKPAQLAQPGREPLQRGRPATWRVLQISLKEIESRAQWPVVVLLRRSKSATVSSSGTYPRAHTLEGRFATHAGDLGSEPLEELRALLVSRQDGPL
jgi:hypothetical protein